MSPEQEVTKKDDRKKPAAQGCSCEKCDIDLTESCREESAESKRKKRTLDGNLIRIAAGALIFTAGIILRKQDFSFLIFSAAYLVLGFEVFINAAKNIFRGKVFDENFLMLIASAGALAIGEFPEAAGVMLFYSVGDFLQDRAVDRSKKSIQSLLSIKPDYANIERDGALIRVSPKDVTVGGQILVKPGEKVPLDGEIVEGFSSLDVSALTGEFLPREVEAGDTVLSGSINITGVLTVRVTAPFSESTASRIFKLISEASGKKAPAENFITRFARYYTPAVVGLAALIMIVPSLFIHGGLTREWFYRGLLALVVSCPCALVLSIPLAYFGGIGAASRRGILVKGGNYLDALVKADTVLFDKTGTLTTGEFAVAEVVPVNGRSREDLLYFAAHGEYYSRHPIARSLREKYGKPLNKDTVRSYEEISGFGVKAIIDGKEVVIGSSRIMRNRLNAAPGDGISGTAAHVAIDGMYEGYIRFQDTIKDSGCGVSEELKKAGVRTVVMLTGDTEDAARETAEKLGMDAYHAGLLPEDKLKTAEKYMTEGHRAIAVGDGINDAPLLAAADIGIAMGAIGSDAAVESADIVLMTDEPSKVPESIRIAHKTKRIVWQNIVFALGVKGLVLVLGSLGLASMYQAIFADVGVALIAILNAARIIGPKQL